VSAHFYVSEIFEGGKPEIMRSRTVRLKYTVSKAKEREKQGKRDFPTVVLPERVTSEVVARIAVIEDEVEDEIQAESERIEAKPYTRGQLRINYKKRERRLPSAVDHKRSVTNR
jgi:hypothetical protein